MRLIITVAGKVQGVFYRASCKEKAIELGIKGFVRNEPDGKVYIEAEGRDELLDQFVSWCNEGPRMARVDQIDVEEGEVKNFTSFEIR